jgi:hypothetical protein
MVVVGLAPRLWFARELRRQGLPVRQAWRRIYVPVTPWFGAALFVGAFSDLLGGLMMLVLGLVCVTVLAAGLIRGAWRFPTALRLLGDPDAWRGARRPYWEDDRQESGRP